MTPPMTAASHSGTPLPCAASVRRMRIAMGTWVAIEATAPDADSAQRGIDSAFAVIAELSRTLDPAATDSDVARINAAACGQPIAVRPGTLALLRFAQRLHRLSEGIFDPCLPSAPGRLSDLTLHDGSPARAESRLPLQLDLGGIAKGFAVDGAVLALKACRCSAGLVNAGGDVRVFGAAVQQVFLRDAGGTYHRVSLTEAALAVSVRAAPGAPSGHRGYYVRRGAAAATRDYAAVRAPDATTADALTKCVLLCPDELCTRLLRQLGAENLS
jgi:thiamine biosynthesis lipoprotein